MPEWKEVYKIQLLQNSRVLLDRFPDYQRNDLWDVKLPNETQMEATSKTREQYKVSLRREFHTRHSR